MQAKEAKEEKKANEAQEARPSLRSLNSSESLRHRYVHMFVVFVSLEEVACHRFLGRLKNKQAEVELEIKIRLVSSASLAFLAYLDTLARLRQTLSLLTRKLETSRNRCAINGQVYFGSCSRRFTQFSSSKKSSLFNYKVRGCWSVQPKKG